jgi:hypothetical protein
LLVNSAEIIAHLVLGLPAEHLAPATLLSGDQFALARIYGVVDHDFFDWVLEVPGGEGYVSAVARQLIRFDWSAVEHDVLKVLYESVIRAETRKALGERYTPDWLANRIVTEAVVDPLNRRVLDPACGGGTFVFYAVRRFLAAADAAAMSPPDSLSSVSSHVMGIDLHPVAVALARVTYLLAIGRERLSAPRGALSVPVCHPGLRGSAEGVVLLLFRLKRCVRLGRSRPLPRVPAGFPEQVGRQERPKHIGDRGWPLHQDVAAVR